MVKQSPKTLDPVEVAHARGAALVRGIRFLMQRDDIKQVPMAGRLGIGFVTLNRWLNGHQVPVQERIHKHLRAYLVRYNVPEKEFTQDP